MLEVDHPHIVKLYEVFESKKNVYLVMELLEGGEMFDRIVKQGNFSEALAAYAVVQILNALIYCHSKGICHRDLKPENLLYCSKEEKSKLVIGDFGLAKKCRDNPMKTCCGTPQYVAPEVLAMQPYTTKVDCWSVGVILYILLCGYPPFYADTHPRLYAKIKEGKFRFDKDDWHGISDGAKDLVKKLLAKDPAKRYSAREAKGHPWLQSAQKYTTPLGKNYLERVRRFNLVRKLRAGVVTTLALCKMARIMRSIMDGEEPPLTSPGRRWRDTKGADGLVSEKDREAKEPEKTNS